MWYFNMWWLINITVIIYLTNLTTGDQPRILIIGAGPAGVAAASKLYEHGFQNVTILEAESRIGGRVYTTWFDESWVDLGGQWVHGETNNIVFELAWPLGLLARSEGRIKFVVHNSKGCEIPNSISNDLIALYVNITDTAADNLKGNNGSLGDYFTTRISSELKEYPAVNQTLEAEFMKLFEGFQNGWDAADSWYDTSARGYAEYADCPGDSAVNWKDRGYGTILEILMKKYPDPDKELPVLNNTILNTEVINVNYNSSDGKVIVETKSGEKYIADHVIVTPSLGVLKEQYNSLFTPSLPEYKEKTIKGISFGAVAKFFLSYETPWWPDNSTAYALIWTENDRKEYENDLDRKWLLDLVGFFTVEYRPRLLYAWINGPGAPHMETLPEHQVFNQTCALLERFFGKSYNITRPTGFLRSTWHSNKHFRGSYSLRTIETEKADVWANELAAPLLVDDKPIVMFAGEATHSSHYSTVHGAVETGFREAERLIDVYKIRKTIE